MTSSDSARTNADPTGNLLDLLTRGQPTKVKNVVAWAIAVSGFALTAQKQLNDWWRSQHFTVVIEDGDEIYNDVREWLLNQLPEKKRKAIEVFTVRSSGYQYGGDYKEERGVFFAYDGSRTQKINIGGHRIEVFAQRRQLEVTNNSVGRDPGKITFTARDAAGRDAVISFMKEIADAHEKAKQGAQIRLATRWGDWKYATEAPSRPLESVVLAEGQREHILGDLERFLADEEEYVRLGIPWHRGYLLYGPPGGGKTSIAKALAEHLRLNLYYMPLSDLEADTDLGRMLLDVQPRSIILLEDIDVVHGAKTRDDSGKGLSLTGLLNALDGVATPHGLITIMTTNYRNVLDDALIRPGRADVQLHISYLDDEQLSRLVKAILGQGVELPSVEGLNITPAEIVELMKPYLRDDAEKTAPILAMEIQTLVEQRVGHDR